MLGLAIAGLLVIGLAWNSYVPLFFAAAPIVAIAGLVFAVASLRWRDNRRSRTLAVIGGGLALLVLLGYVYALLAHAGGN
jgi:hypothetical protein